MANNKYTGNSSAYGFGKVMDEMDHRWDQAPKPPQVPQSFQAPSSQPNPNSSIIGANAGGQAVENLTKTYGMPTDLNQAVNLRDRSVKAGVDGGYDFYQQGINKAIGHYGSYDAASKAGNISDFWQQDSFNAMQKNLGNNIDDMATLGVNQTLGGDQSQDPWYGSLPETSGQGAGPKTPGNYPQVTEYTEYDSDLAKTASHQKLIEGQKLVRQKERFESIWDPGLPNTADQGLGTETPGNYPKLANANPNDTLPGGVVDLDKLDLGEIWGGKAEAPTVSTAGFTESGAMTDVSPEQVDWQVGEKSPGLGLAADKHPSLFEGHPKKFDPMAKGTVSTDLPDVAAKTGGGFMETAGKAAPYVAAGANVLSTFSQMDQRGDVIGDLKDSVSSMEGMIGSLANTEHAEESAMFDEYTEGNRRIGEGRNLALGNRLDAVKGSNITSGTVKRIKKDLTQDFHRSTDLSLAAAADTYEKKRDQYVSDSRDTRAKANEELKKLRDQLKEQERQQAMAPYSLAADLAIGVIGAANPLVGMGLSAMKNKAFS